MTCDACGRELTIGQWPFCPHGETSEQVKQWHESEAVVVFRDAKGKLRYPGRNDVPTPAGYERVVMRDDRTLARFERDNHVMNERRHYDSNGRAN